MALEQGIFSGEWAFVNRPLVRSAMTARVLIERVVKQGKWDVETGEVTGEETEKLYQGIARVQKYARSVRREHVNDAADSQGIQVQIPIELELNELHPTVFPDYQANDRVRVLEDVANPQHTGKIMWVHSDAGSSNDWLVTLTCRSNQKQGQT